MLNFVCLSKFIQPIPSSQQPERTIETCQPWRASGIGCCDQWFHDLSVGWSHRVLVKLVFCVEFGKNGKKHFAFSPKYR